MQNGNDASNSHAILDERSRQNKAEKLLTLVQRLHHRSKFRRMLEVGAGSGFISAYCAKVTGAQAWAVDVKDERKIVTGFEFRLVEDTKLPFGDEYFDLIVSNHVIEHVGDRYEQQHHLAEIYRCLEPNGTLYFAVPNQWRLIEPHYKLPLLSWMPLWMASLYLRCAGKAERYDCRPLSRKSATRLLKNAGFNVQDATFQAISLIGEIEGGLLLRGISTLPCWMWRPLLPIMPTLIYVCRKPPAPES